MGIEIASGGVSKTFRYYPYDAFYVDANGNLNTNGNGEQVMEAWFNGTKYYPEAGDDSFTLLANLPYDHTTPSIDSNIYYFPSVIACGYMADATNSKVYIKNAKLILPSCVRIGHEAFAYKEKLTAIELPICTYVGYWAFEETGLTEINLPLCTYIGFSAFARCASLATVELPLCEEIRSSTFSRCTSLRTAYLPACMSLKEYAFYQCTSLQTITLKTGCTIENGAVPSTCEIIYV